MGRQLPHTQDRRLPRILVVDDHLLFRAALRQLLHGRRSGLEVVGEAEDGEGAIEQCRRLRPDLVLMDVGMPRMDGIEATRAIKQEFPEVIVLVLTALADPNLLARALKAGAGGYVLKDTGRQEFVNTVLSVLEGEYALDQELAARLLVYLLKHDQEAQEATVISSPTSTTAKVSGEPAEVQPLDLLSKREIEVLRLVACGRTNYQIARDLRISPSTVKKHMRRIVSKLDASDRVQAVVKAMELGLLQRGKFFS